MYCSEHSSHDDLKICLQIYEGMYLASWQSSHLCVSRSAEFMYMSQSRWCKSAPLIMAEFEINERTPKATVHTYSFDRCNAVRIRYRPHQAMAS